MRNDIGLAVGHFPIVIGDPKTNLASEERLAKKAVAEGAEFILFPEDALTGYPGAAGSANKVALDADGAEIRRLIQIARELKLIIASGFIERRAGLLHSTHAIARPDGSVEFIRKRSCDGYDTNIGLVASKDENADLMIGGVKAAMAICMDGTLAFFDTAAKRGVKLILHPSGGACSKWAHETEALARELDAKENENCQRCVEAACGFAKRLGAIYMVSNPIGFDGERGYPGNSFIISPGGEVLVHLGPTAIIEHMREAVGAAHVKVPS